MKTFAINTLGCKVNQYESQQIRELLEELGLQQVTADDKPDFAIINTCCVTLSASAKSRQYIKKAQKQNPHSTIIVCGCLPTVQLGELNKTGDDVYLIRNRKELAPTLVNITHANTTASNSNDFQINMYNDIKAKNRSKSKLKSNSEKNFELPQLTSFKDHTRAFLKIQDGCNGNCTYCIIPKTRPYVHSRPTEDVLQEARALVAAGHKEIVLTGVFLGSYGQNTVIRKKWPQQQNDKLAELLDNIAQIPNLARIRLSSLEPADVTDRLLETFRKNRNIMPHLHLSLQSGSDKILKRMCRQYSISEFKEKIDLIKTKLDSPAITADIIVGFPGETDKDFEATVNLAEKVEFAKMHIFPFSARLGTAAAKMQDTVNNKVIKERSLILRSLADKLEYRFRGSFIPGTDTILLENSKKTVYGRSRRYFKVYLNDKADKNLKQNDLVQVKLVGNRENGAIGKAVKIYHYCSP